MCDHSLTVRYSLLKYFDPFLAISLKKIQQWGRLVTETIALQ